LKVGRSKAQVRSLLRKHHNPDASLAADE
jgi:hypothetical protein